MKNYSLTILFSLLLFLTSCSSGGSSDDPYSVEGAWEYDYWNLDGTNLLDDDTEAYIFICEETGIWVTEIWYDGSITNLSSAGTFTVNDDNTNATFNLISIYDPTIETWVNIDPIETPVSINKLDNNELDFSFSREGIIETIRTSKDNSFNACNPSSAKQKLLQ